jgi:hypothetical protein
VGRRRVRLSVGGALLQVFVDSDELDESLYAEVCEFENAVVSDAVDPDENG